MGMSAKKGRGFFSGVSLCMQIKPKSVAVLRGVGTGGGGSAILAAVQVGQNWMRLSKW